MNAAFMAKLKWDLEIQTKKPWTIFFKQKYGNATLTNHKRNISYIYRSIYKDKNSFSNNINHIIRNVKNTNLWKDSWFNNLPLRKQLTRPLPQNEDEKEKFSNH